MSQMGEESDSANEAGRVLADAGRHAEAIPAYQRAIRLAPGWYAPHLNLGISCKHTGDWARSLAASLRAFELDPAQAGNGALWNAGVAATALGDWPRARWAWTKVGIVLPAGEGPVDMNIGATPIRVGGPHHPEVVWCHRLDPARARIESIPTPETGRRHQDLVLHDGEPKGKRRYGDALLSVFDELALLERSPFRTWRVDVVAPAEEDVVDLCRFVANDTDAAVEDWTASLAILCKHCSEGVPHEHAPEPKSPWTPERAVALATKDESAFGVLSRWVGSGHGRAASVPFLLTP